LRKSSISSLQAIERPLLERTIAAVRTSLGEGALEAAWLEGAATSADRATELTVDLAWQVQDAIQMR
jgi:hypothetical protein